MSEHSKPSKKREEIEEKTFNLSELDPNIFYYKNVIASPDYVIDRIEKIVSSELFASWEPGAASDNTSHVFGAKRPIYSHNYDLSSAEDRDLYDLIYLETLECVEDYATKHKINLPNPQPPSISKYFMGAKMGPHVDDHGDTRFRPILSAVLYLNDDYDGGELHFKNQGITIKPEAGSLVIFPSIQPYVHESKTIQKGIKYMSTFFWMHHNSK